ncbi:MAG: DegV family EDD domain-containing protein [Lachnospiraceae bacterium]|nr:DegV family EDD domain-containing protein [Lachnospiraceae bacterium]
MITKFFKYIRDKERRIQDRQYALVSAIGLVTLLIVFIMGLFVGESKEDLLILGGFFVVFGIIAFFSFRYKKVPAGIVISVFLIVFILLPITFFTGGGVYGGSPCWFILCMLLISMMMNGAVKWFFLVCNALVAAGCYALSYLKPELVTRHTYDMVYADSFLSVLIIGGMITLMVEFVIRAYKDESLRSEEREKKIEELNEAQNRFFSNMSHEIRTPINTIIGLNEMNLRENLSEEVNENAVNIQSASRMLLHLINDILDMSKIESGQMKLTVNSYNTGDMLSDIVGMLWMRAKDKGLDFRVDLADDLPSVLMGDEVRIKQILINVLNNAIKYTNEGSVTLSIQAKRRENEDALIIYTVSDTGIGIKKENLPYLFNAFKRVDEEKNKYIEGTGLGLSIVKQLVDLMGGTITVNSIYTKGSSFIIEIPQHIVDDSHLRDTNLEERRRNISAYEYHQSFEAPSAEILIVDDTVENLLVAEKLLRDTKVKIDTATGGKEALKKTLEKKYQVIFMDHLMPKMDGVECLHRIREQVGGLNKDSKIIALTASAGSDIAAMFAKEGFDGYLEKPITGDRLENELRKNLPRDMIVLTGSGEEILEESMLWIRDLEKKEMVMITTESVADLPASLARKNGILILPHMVETEDGLFRDGKEIEQNGLLAYMKDEKAKVKTKAPDVEEHENFFAYALNRANNVVHISISSKVAHSGYYFAKEAAKAFDNVTVVDSGHLSSGQGLMALTAYKMAQEGAGPEEIAKALNSVKKRVNTGFIVDGLEYLSRAGQVSSRIAGITRAFMIRPVLALKKGRIGVGKVYFGSRERAWKRYINSTLRNPSEIDNSLLFVTYVGLSHSDIEKIKTMIEGRMKFDEICFQKASPAIAVNCGPGTFGLLFVRKE